MQKKWNKKLLSYFLCMMLTVAMAWLTIGCSKIAEKENLPASQEEADQNQTSNQDMGTDKEQDQTSNQDVGTDKVTVLGEGDTIFSFLVVEKEGKETKETLFEIHTDKETVGEALLELELIDGKKSEYGLYVKTVNDITIDYDKDGMYWAFYINDEYAQTGVDSTVITEGDQYSFKMEKG